MGRKKTEIVEVNTEVRGQNEEDILRIAAGVSSILSQIDENFSEEDINLLENAADRLRESLCFNNKAAPVILAMGGVYNPDLDEAKLEEMEAFITLAQARMVVKETADKSKKQGAMNDLLLSGAFGL